MLVLNFERSLQLPYRYSLVYFHIGVHCFRWKHLTMHTEFSNSGLLIVKAIWLYGAEMEVELIDELWNSCCRPGSSVDFLLHM